MRVLVDASGITRHKAGVGVYAKNLIDALVLHRDLQIFLVAQDDDPELDHSRRANVTMIRVPSALMRNPFFRIAFEQTVLPFLLWKHGIQVVHSLHYSFPLLSFGAHTVVTIHDMTSFSMPELHIPLKRRLYRFFIRAGSRLANGLIFVSHSAEHDMRARFGPPHGLSTTIHHGKSELFRPCLEQQPLAEVRAKYGLPPRFILYIGTLEPRKNLVGLVNAFAAVAGGHPDVHLVLAGMKGWMYEELFARVAALGLEQRILFPGFVAEQDKPSLLCAAYVFAYVSLYEGFGLPVLEALACALPVLTSNTSSLPEVAGEAALLVDPRDAAQISAALESLLSESALRARLCEAAIVQAARFTWERTAEATHDFYFRVDAAGK